MKSVSLPFDSSCQAYCLSISRAKFHAEKRGVVVTYHKVASSNTSRLEAHAGFFRLHIEGIFDPYVL